MKYENGHQIIETYTKPAKVWRQINYNMDKSADIAKYLARHPYAWPGGYPLYAYTSDGAALCHKCCKSEYWYIKTSNGNDGWHVVGISANYEDSSLYCDNCNDQIECAYCG